jgi:hypothetical protein
MVALCVVLQLAEVKVEKFNVMTNRDVAGHTTAGDWVPRDGVCVEVYKINAPFDGHNRGR